MGMEFARLYFDFFASEKTQFLIDECGEPGVICLLRLWVRAGQRNNDGVFKKTGRALEKIAGWKGEPGKLIKTIIDPDFTFLDKVSDNEFILHNWEDNNPHLGEKAQVMRRERARKAGLASAGKRKEEQEQSNSESTTSQPIVNSIQLDPTNLTKRNVTKRNVIKDSVEQIVDSIITKWNETSNQTIHLTTENPYRAQIRGRIKELKKQEITTDDDIMKAFEFIINNKRLHAEDDTYERFTKHDWNLTTLTRPTKFMKYLHEPEYSKPTRTRSPEVEAVLDNMFKMEEE